MTLLYVLGTGSKWQDNELRYSLRSAYAHVDVRTVVVAGECPSWLRDVVHVPCTDNYAQGVACTLHKLLIACQDPRVPAEFVLMNDDFLFLEDHPSPLPTYVRGTIQQRVSEGPRLEKFYYGMMQQALAVLRKQGIAEPLDFDGHHPMPMNKSAVLAMAARYGGSGSVYPWRSYYGNMHPGATVYARDPKLYSWREPRGGFISLGDELPRSKEFVCWIEQRFPDPSPYES